MGESSYKYLQKCPNSPHSGPVGWQLAPNIFPLAKTFAKGKMFLSEIQIQYDSFYRKERILE